MKITLLTIGKNSDKKIEELISRYVERLKFYVKYDNLSLPDVKLSKNESTEKQKQLEGASVLSSVKPSDFVILLDERGREYTSREFANFIESHMINATRDIVFVVGGPYGFSQEVYDRANSLISLSKMTLTHEMARLFFVEQLYRAFTIIRGENYHHD